MNWHKVQVIIKCVFNEIVGATEIKRTHFRALKQSVTILLAFRQNLAGSPL